MNKKIQPEYNETTITCACGNVYKVGSTKKDMKVDIVFASELYEFLTKNKSTT